ncbi:MAG: hypothetical protein LUD79_09150 [Oscillospiraceae bacterium]|nr:hypothetical protein [Oscillospiraceae bacterium]
MIGQLIWTGSRRPGVQLREGEVAGLRVLQAQLPGNGASRRAERIWARALSLLERHGANQLLTPTNSAFPIQRRIVTRELWRSAAIPLALDTLDRAGQRRSRAVVGLSARQVTPQLLQWCRLLAAQVRGLSLDLNTGRDALEWQLQRELGLPIFQGGGDVNLDL